MRKPKLTVVVLNFNTKDYLRDCLKSLKNARKVIRFEVIIPDNGSTDGSVEMVEKEFPWVKKIVKNKRNLGFAAGNNTALPFVKSKYVLFLNSDTKVPKNTISKTIKYLEAHGDVGALTCKIELPNGQLDKDARRSFITPWIGLTHLYLKLDRIFPHSKLFSQYWYGYLSENKIHEVDALQGAFFLVRKKVLDQVGWFDEDYFLDGEDIDLCWKIKQAGWKIIYYPKAKIVHYKGASKGKVESETRKNVPLKEKLRYRMAGVNSMEIFVKKRLWGSYPLPLMLFVLTGIKLMKVIRIGRTILFG
jgi:GT2 family glycosyltransferase